MQLVPEESGRPIFLKDRLAQEGIFEAVHVSCHGHIIDGEGPVLALETPEGDLDLTTAGDFANVLGERKAPLVFVSACERTGTTRGRGGIGISSERTPGRPGPAPVAIRRSRNGASEGTPATRSSSTRPTVAFPSQPRGSSSAGGDTPRPF